MQYDVSREMLDNIYAVGSENLIRQSLINRYKKEGLGKGYQMAGSFNAVSTIKLKGSDDYINLIGQVSYDKRKEDLSISMPYTMVMISRCRIPAISTSETIQTGTFSISWGQPTTSA
mgnify:CR=1 FL=1